MISTQSQLTEFLPQVRAEEPIALDTEADSLHAYPEKLCLIQVSAGGTDALIDPLARFDLRPLFDILRGKELIFHGADYDLRLLHRTFGFIPTKVFDTMWAARLLGYTEFGLQVLVQQHLAITLEKAPQKMNWGIRPLTERMAVYALNDTRHLRPLAELLRSQLRESGRIVWQEEACAKVVKESTKPRAADPETRWRVKGSDRLDYAAMAVLREIWRWREEEAIAANKPPYFILSHEKLVAVADAVAQGRPADPLIPHFVSAKRVARLAAAIQRGMKVAPADYPRHRRSSVPRLTRQELLAFEQFKQARDARAAGLRIDPTLIASKADLVLLARNSSEGQAQLLPWQRRLLNLS